MCGSQGTQARARLLGKTDLSLKKSLETCKSFELSKHRTRTLEGQLIEPEHKIQWKQEKPNFRICVNAVEKYKYYGDKDEVMSS